MNADSASEDLATALARMARTLLAQQNVQDTLDQITSHAVRLVEGCEAAGILTMLDDHGDTLSATNELARSSDRIQVDIREGPCLDAAYRRQESYRIPDLGATSARCPDTHRRRPSWESAA